MPQQELTPKDYHVALQDPSTSSTLLHLVSNDTAEPTHFTFEAVRPGLYRTTFSSSTHPLPPVPSAPRPQQGDSSAFQTTTDAGSNTQTFQCPHPGTPSTVLEAKVEWQLTPVVTLGFAGEEPLHTDLPLRSYVLDGPGIAHYSHYHRPLTSKIPSLYLGLGEKAAPLDLSNRSFTLSATDSFGYYVHRTDPLYKHIPLLIRATPKGVVGVFSTSHSRGFYSVGGEMDGMWGPFTVYRQDHGGLEEYLMLGRNLEEVVKLYADLVGYPLLVPRWAFGYLAGGMKYSMLDHPRASVALMEFAEKLKEHNIPCSGFQMSSGYTVAEVEPKTRNVFTWNRHRFPDPKAFCDEFHRRGIRLIANIKPYILASHPEYARLVKAGAFFTDPRTGEAGVARLWSAGGGESGEGGHIDFSYKAGRDFWHEGVRQLRRVGVDCMWNDNNEYVISSDDWELALDMPTTDGAREGSPRPALRSASGRRDLGVWGRALHTELMARVSHDALTSVYPHERPFVLTRSATAGTMRHACSSWSGDNITSWEGMRGANALSLNAGMCLLQCYGHDIGGFEGPQPSPELLLRWVQLGVHSPRFAINCFKTVEDNNIGDVIEPWMYPEILPNTRDALNRRYETMPHLYSLMLKSHLTAVPPQRWVGWGYESDDEVWRSKVLRDGEQQYWLGSTLLVGGVYEPGVSEASMYLPRRSAHDPGFLNTNEPFDFCPAGSWVTVPSPWTKSIPVLARIGGLVPVGKCEQVAAPGDKINEADLPADDWRGVEIFPPRRPDSQWYEESWLEDDGISPPPAKMAEFTLSYRSTHEEVHFSLRADCSSFKPPWVALGLTIILPVGDDRLLVSSKGNTVDSTSYDKRGRRCFHVAPPVI